MNDAGTAVALNDLNARIVHAFGAGGALAASVPGFVPRASQAEMALTVHRAISAGDTLVAEAGTGTGKTFAYLVPALLSGGKLLISTGTKPLQDQLYRKDLPAVLGALKLNAATALLKGRANYLCLHRMNVGRGSGDDRASVDENRMRLRALLPADPAWLKQVHGATVVDAAEAAAVPGGAEADAAITDRAQVVAAVMVADCMPVLLADTRGRCVAAVHAGWRGLAAGVIQRAVRALRERLGDPDAQLLAYLGPAIGPDHFEVGSDVLEAMSTGLNGAAAAFVRRDDRYMADLFALGRNALKQENVDAIYGGDVCTVCDPSRFYSHRRDRVTGRHAALIWIEPDRVV